MCQITSGATGHGWCTILGRARLEGPLSQLFPWKTEPRLICPKLTEDLSYGTSCLPLRWQVPTTIPKGTVQVWVNVPNHVWSCWPWMMHHPGQGQAGRILVSLFPWKTESRLICPKLTGDLPHGRGCLPWRQQVPTTIPWGAVQVWVNVPNHVWSCQPWMMHHPGQGKAGRTLVSALPLKNWTQTNLPKTHREPSPWWGLPPLKMGSPYHHPSRSSKGASKCAKLCLELLNVHHAHESGGAGLLSPLAQIPWKLNLGQSARNS